MRRRKGNFSVDAFFPVTPFFLSSFPLKRERKTALPEHDLARESPDQRDARNRKVNVCGQFPAVFGEVNDADRGLGEPDDEEVVGIGEKADPGDEDGLF